MNPDIASASTVDHEMSPVGATVDQVRAPASREHSPNETFRDFYLGLAKKRSVAGLDLAYTDLPMKGVEHT